MRSAKLGNHLNVAWSDLIDGASVKPFRIGYNLQEENWSCKFGAAGNKSPSRWAGWDQLQVEPEMRSEGLRKSSRCVTVWLQFFFFSFSFRPEWVQPEGPQRQNRKGPLRGNRQGPAKRTLNCGTWKTCRSINMKFNAATVTKCCCIHTLGTDK